MEDTDRKMFARMFRSPARSPEAEVCAFLAECGAGATPSLLADGLLRSGAAIGSKVSVTKRVTELHEDLVRASRVERIPDGRFRVVKARR
jgi:hypothetical protein